MIYGILVCAILLSCGKSLLMRGVSNSAASKITFWKNNTVIFLVAFLVTFLLYGKVVLSAPPSLYTALLSVLFACSTALAQVFYIYAQSMGSVSLNTFIYSCGFIIPAIYGICTDRKSFSVYKLVALVLLAVVLYVFILPTKNKFSPLHMVYIFTATVFSGVIAIIQNVHQTSARADEFESFLCLAFAMCFLLSLACYVVCRSRNRQSQSAPALCIKDIIPILCGVVIAFLNRCTLYLAGAMPAIVFFPVFNGSVVILTGVFAAWIFKEKLCLRQIICLGFGIVAIMLFNI